MKLFTRLMLLLAGIAVVVPAALAADPNEKAIKARRAVMTLRSWYAGPLFMMAKGDMAYDAAAASTTAAHLKMVVNAEAGGDVARRQRQHQVFGA